MQSFLTCQGEKDLKKQISNLKTGRPQQKRRVRPLRLNGLTNYAGAGANASLFTTYGILVGSPP